jgi:DNA-binding MurR/RpiR family transcriptional regulator
MPNSVPSTLADLKAKIASEHVSLSKRLRQVARYLLDHPNEIAFGTVAVIAKDAEVHPSTLVRFANAFGYTGFSEMQRLFQQHLLHESPSYSDRIRLAKKSLGEETSEGPVGLLHQFADANSSALKQLLSDIDVEQLQAAGDILRDAEAIYVMGVRRAFSVASYFSYALRHADRRSILIDGIGGLTHEQAGSMRKGDALIAISFHPYGQETQAVARDAIERGIPVVLLTDSELSPLASEATAVLALKEADVHGIRSLSASLCVAQALSIGLTEIAD